MNIVEANKILNLAKSVENELISRGSAPSTLVKDLMTALEFALSEIGGADNEVHETTFGVLKQ